jgi:aryl-phospho-beta-D-glucosidase BglC (GH1 family)
MKRILHKITHPIKKHDRWAQNPEDSSVPQQQPVFNGYPEPPTGHRMIAAPTANDVLRYRYHHGVNLGSIFVLERWLYPSMFECEGSSVPEGKGSELDAVTHAVKVLGMDRAKAKFEAHWSSAISDAEFEWLVNVAHVTSIRLPVGYFTLGAQFCAGTSFEAVAAVYSRSWDAVRNLVARARSYNIGVLLDLHALPGGANRDAHSGTSSGKAELWGSIVGKGSNIERANRCVEYLAKEASNMDGVIGLQIVNEAVWDARGLYGWYEDVLKRINRIDPTLPIYVSDGWDLERALKWSNGRTGGNPVVVDTHRYFCFSDKDRSQAPAEILDRVPRELQEIQGKDGSLTSRGEAQLIVGEYSCVLDGKTWSRIHPEFKDGSVKQFGQSQSKTWHKRTGGSYFWTFKMDWMEGGEWGFVEQVKRGNLWIPPNFSLSPRDVSMSLQVAVDRREELAESAERQHAQYWSKAAPNGTFEHARYAEGWEVGYSDAQRFYEARARQRLGSSVDNGADTIGCLDIWVKKRLGDAAQSGPFAWEWEQGLRAGIKAFQDIVGI